MDSIGGFFELEVGSTPEYLFPWVERFHSGRGALLHILKSRNYSKIHIPELYCPEVIDMLKNEGIPYEIYLLNDLLMPVLDIEALPDDEVVLICEYFVNRGVGEAYSKKFRSKVIIDNTHNFDCDGYDQSFSFNSLRKWFPIPDGALLHHPKTNAIERLPRDRGQNPDIKTDHLIPSGNLEKKYLDYKLNERRISSKPYRMSDFSERVFTQERVQRVINARLSNLFLLHGALHEFNKLTKDDFFKSFFKATGISSAPFCYPFLPKKPITKASLASKGILVPIYWKESPAQTPFVKELIDNLLPLPIDERITPRQLGEMVQIITELSNE